MHLFRNSKYCVKQKRQVFFYVVSFFVIELAFSIFFLEEIVFIEEVGIERNEEEVSNCI